ncbi:hypothetical protein VCSRO6_0962 [Vibrio cholerae]|nr:hypothetical protein VCSRO6_0962 [Vibrio cholerae]
MANAILIGAFEITFFSLAILERLGASAWQISPNYVTQ